MENSWETRDEFQPETETETEKAKKWGEEADWLVGVFPSDDPFCSYSLSFLI